MKLTNNHIQKMKRWADSEWQLSPTVIVSMGDIIIYIETQQAEIEQLRAELDKYKAQFTMLQQEAIRSGLTEETTAYLHPELQQQPEPPQESLTPAELGEIAGKAEKMIALHKDILTVLVEGVASTGTLSKKMKMKYPSMGKVLDDMWADDLIILDRYAWKITAAGRDYLASLDKPEAERYIIPVRDDR